MKLSDDIWAKGTFLTRIGNGTLSSRDGWLHKNRLAGAYHVGLSYPEASLPWLFLIVLCNGLTLGAFPNLEAAAHYWECMWPLINLDEFPERKKFPGASECRQMFLQTNDGAFPVKAEQVIELGAF